MAELKLRFHPQAWVNGYAIDVDPEGETEWSIDWNPNEVPPDDDQYESDDLIDENAPEWIQEFIHHGPFYVEILNREDFPEARNV
jgi:hypothetical protein